MLKLKRYSKLNSKKEATVQAIWEFLCWYETNKV